MACERVSLNQTGNNNNSNIILETVKRIDQIQKETLIESQCVGCTGNLITKAFDTRPITFTFNDDSKFTAFIGFTDEETNLFRIEDIQGDFVLLRLLENNSGCVTCTNQTAILDLNCICCIQCFEAIKCNISESFSF